MTGEEELTAREVRVSEFGLLRCPSCGELAAEILGRHALVLGGEGAEMWCECRDGRRVGLSVAENFGELKAAANIALADDFWLRSEAALARLVIGNWEGGS